MAITKVQQSALLTQLWTPDNDWQSPGNVTLTGVAAGNLVVSLGAWWDTVRSNGAAQGIPTDSNGTLAAGISPTLPDTTPAPGWPVSGQICRILSAAAGNHVITPPGLGVDGDGLFFAAEFSGGVAGTWTQVEAASNIALSGTPGAVDGVSVSTAGAAQVGDLVVALCTTDGNPSAIGVGAPSGFANEILLTTTTTVNIAAGAGWMIATSAGAQTASWTWADNDCQLGQACIAVFRFTPSGPTITADPTNQTVNNGATATFSVTATGTAPITYQWQDNSSGSFANIGGATSSSYSPTASYAAQGRQYRCVVTDANGSATSAAATLRVAFNTSGTGPRSVPRLGHPFGAGSSESYIRGTASGGAPSHATSGALAAQAATIAGTADHRTLHPTSGALASQSATIAGSATHLLLHTTTGALSAQAATISGTAQHQHAATGALVAQAATVAGSAAHLTLHTTTGALSAQAATIAGSAAHQHAATGALQAQSATISGAADHTAAGASHGTSGALNADAATIAGAATHLTLHATTGTLSAQSATISGAALHPHTTSGALQAQSATLAGTAAHLTLHTTSGALAAQAATLSGAAAHEHASAGALTSQSATVAGTATHAAAGVHIATGALQAGDASISGSAAAPVQRQILGGWAKYRRQDRPDDEEGTKSPQPDDTPVVEVVAPRQRIRGRIRIADIAARLAEQQQADADALERQAVERARRKRRQQQEEELLLF